MLTPEEVAKEHEALNLELSKVLWDFTDKHSTDNKREGHQSFFIMQSVLSEYQSNIEYQNGKMAPLTDRQIDHICYQIGEWYMMMKPLLEGQHNLGFMKEKLKTMICGEL